MAGAKTAQSMTLYVKLEFAGAIDCNSARRVEGAGDGGDI
jgi:hypothetical protein